MEYILFGSSSVESSDIENYIVGQGEINGIMADIEGRMRMINSYSESIGFGFIGILKAALTAMMKFIGSFKFIISAIVGGLLAFIRKKKMFGKTADISGGNFSGITKASMSQYGVAGIDANEMAEEARKPSERRKFRRFVIKEFVDKINDGKIKRDLVSAVEETIDPAFLRSLTKDTIAESIKRDGNKVFNNVLRVQTDDNLVTGQLHGNKLIFNLIKDTLSDLLKADSPLVSQMRDLIHQHGPISFLNAGTEYKNVTSNMCRLYNTHQSNFENLLSENLAGSSTLLTNAGLILSLASNTAIQLTEMTEAGASTYQERVDRRMRAVSKALDNTKVSSYGSKIIKNVKEWTETFEKADSPEEQQKSVDKLVSDLYIGHTRYSVNKPDDYSNVLGYLNKVNSDLFVDISNPMDLDINLSESMISNNLIASVIELAPRKNFDDYLYGNKVMLSLVRHLTAIQLNNDIDVNEIKKVCDKLLGSLKETSVDLGKLNTVSEEVGYMKKLITDVSSMISIVLTTSNVFLKVTRTFNHPVYQLLSLCVQGLAQELLLLGLEGVAEDNENR